MNTELFQSSVKVTYKSSNLSFLRYFVETCLKKLKSYYLYE